MINDILRHFDVGSLRLNKSIKLFAKHVSHRYLICHSQCEPAGGDHEPLTTRFRTTSRRRRLKHYGAALLALAAIRDTSVRLFFYF